MSVKSRLTATTNRVAAPLAVAWLPGLPAQADTRHFAARAHFTGDTSGTTFAVIDKVAATLSLYDNAGKLSSLGPIFAQTPSAAQAPSLTVS